MAEDQQSTAVKAQQTLALRQSCYYKKFRADQGHDWLNTHSKFFLNAITGAVQTTEAGAELLLLWSLRRASSSQVI